MSHFSRGRKMELLCIQRGSPDRRYGKSYLFFLPLLRRKGENALRRREVDVRVNFSQRTKRNSLALEFGEYLISFRLVGELITPGVGPACIVARCPASRKPCSPNTFLLVLNPR